MATDFKIEKSIEECTPSTFSAIAHKVGESSLKGAVAGAVTGLLLGAETGPGALIASGIGGAIGTAVGGAAGFIEGIFTPLEPDGACMKKELLSENISPLDTPANPLKPVTPTRIV